MSGSLGLIEMVLVFGAVLAFAGLELFSLRRAKRRAKMEEGQAVAKMGSPGSKET